MKLQESIEARWWVGNFTGPITATAPIFINDLGAETLYVLRHLDLANVGGSAGNLCRILESFNASVFHQGQIGAGAADVFHWDGYLGFSFNDGFTADVSGGTWCVSWMGYYVPDYFQQLGA